MATRALVGSSRRPEAGDGWRVIDNNDSRCPGNRRRSLAVACCFVYPGSICIKGLALGLFGGSVSFSLGHF